jgi:hypothetical protein
MSVVGAGSSWYQKLGVDSASPTEVIAKAIERFSRQASVLANTDPDRSQQMRDTVRAMRRDLMSGDEARKAYDERLRISVATTWQVPHPIPSVPPPAPYSGRPHPPPEGPIDGAASSVRPVVDRFRRFLQSGWTCPSCAAEGTPSDRFCTKCGSSMARTPPASPAAREFCSNCRGEFHAGERFCSRCATARA